MMTKRFISAAFVAGIAILQASAAAWAAGGAAMPALDWSFNGVFGSFDQAQLKRGWLVYKDVCANCHSLRLVRYRNLQAIGFSKDEVKKIAAEFEVPAGPNAEGETASDKGEPFMRKAKPFDAVVSPFANELAARAANNGAMPTDLSLITKARKGGADYVHALLTGYKEEPPKGVKLADGMSYNLYFPGNQIAMGPPLDDEAVEYKDGTKPTLNQHALDITAFLVWAAEPELEERKRLGIKVILFMIVLTAMLYALKRRIWSRLH